MEMRDGTDHDVVKVVEAAGAGPEAARAGPVAEAELWIDDFGELGGGSDWEAWVGSMGDWVAGTGVDTEKSGAVIGAGGGAKGVGPKAGAGGGPDGASGPQGGTWPVPVAGLEGLLSLGLGGW